MDGAKEFQEFFRVVLPNARPALATLFILFSLEYWNNLLWPLTVFRRAQNMPLAVGEYVPVVVGLGDGRFNPDDSAIIILFFFLRRQVMEGGPRLERV